MEYEVSYNVNGEKWTCKMGPDNFLARDRYCYKNVLTRKPLKSQWVNVFKWYPEITKKHVVSHHLRPIINTED